MKGKKGGKGGGAAVKGSAEASHHVLEEESVQIAEMQVNALKILRYNCDACGREATPGTQCEFAVIAILADGKPIAKPLLIVPTVDLAFKKHTGIAVGEKILPLMVMKWMFMRNTVATAGKLIYISLPHGTRVPLDDGDVVDAVVLAMGACTCILTKAYNDKSIYVFEDLETDVETWHTSDLSCVSDAEDKKWAPVMFRKHYSGYVRNKASTAQAKNVRNIRAAEKELAEDEAQMREDVKAAPILMVKRKVTEAAPDSSVDEGFNTGGVSDVAAEVEIEEGEIPEGKEDDDDVVPPSDEEEDRKKKKKTTPRTPIKTPRTPIKTPKKPGAVSSSTPRKTNKEIFVTPPRSEKSNRGKRETDKEKAKEEEEAREKEKEELAKKKQEKLAREKKEKEEKEARQKEEEEAREKEEEEAREKEKEELARKKQEKLAQLKKEKEEKDAIEKKRIEEIFAAKNEELQARNRLILMKRKEDEVRRISRKRVLKLDSDETEDEEVKQSVEQRNVDLEEEILHRRLANKVYREQIRPAEKAREKAARGQEIKNLPKFMYKSQFGRQTAESERQALERGNFFDFSALTITPVIKGKPKEKPERGEKEESEEEDSEEESQEEEDSDVSEEEEPPKSKAKPQPAKKKEVPVEESDEESEEEEQPPKSKAKPQPAKKKEVPVEESDEESEEEEEPPKSKAKPQPVKKKVVPVEESSEESEEEEEPPKSKGKHPPVKVIKVTPRIGQEDHVEEMEVEVEDSDADVEIESSSEADDSDNDPSWNKSMKGKDHFEIMKERRLQIVQAKHDEWTKELDEMDEDNEPSQMKRMVVQGKLAFLKSLFSMPDEELRKIPEDQWLDHINRGVTFKETSFGQGEAPGRDDEVEDLPLTPSMMIREAEVPEGTEPLELAGDPPLDNRIPAIVFGTAEEQMAIAMHRLEVDKGKNKAKKQLNKKLRQTIQSVSDAIDIFNEDATHKLNVKDVETNMENLMTVAFDAMSTARIDSVVESTKRVLDPMKKLANLVKIQQQNFCDLQLRFAVMHQSYEILKRQLNFIRAASNLGQPFVLDEGGDFDDQDDFAFQEALHNLRSEAFDSEHADDLVKADYVEVNINEFVTKTKALPRLRMYHGEKHSVFPEAAFVRADKWHGNHTLPLDLEKLREFSAGKTPCHVAVRDRRLIDPKTGQPGMLLRYCGEDVWLPQTVFDTLWEGLSDVPMKAEKPKNTKERDSLREIYRPVAEAVVSTLFEGGLLGGELFNFFSSYHNPITEKKLRIVRNIVQFYVSYIVNSGKAHADEFKMTWSNVHSAIVRMSNRERCNRVVRKIRGRTGKPLKAKDGTWIVEIPGSPFYRHYDEHRNWEDSFIREVIDHPSIGANGAFLQRINEIRKPGGKKRDPAEEAGGSEEVPDSQAMDGGDGDQTDHGDAVEAEGRQQVKASPSKGKRGRPKGSKNRPKVTEQQPPAPLPPAPQPPAPQPPAPQPPAPQPSAVPEPSKREYKVTHHWEKHFPTPAVAPIPPSALMPPPDPKVLQKIDEVSKNFQRRLQHNRLMRENREKAKKFRQKNQPGDESGKSKLASKAPKDASDQSTPGPSGTGRTPMQAYNEGLAKKRNRDEEKAAAPKRTATARGGPKSNKRKSSSEEESSDDSGDDSGDEEDEVPPEPKNTRQSDKGKAKKQETSDEEEEAPKPRKSEKRKAKTSESEEQEEAPKHKKKKKKKMASESEEEEEAPKHKKKKKKKMASESEEEEEKPKHKKKAVKKAKK